MVPLVIFLLGSGALFTLSITMQEILAYDESYNQAEMQTDECGNKHTTLSVMCQNLGSETRGDYNAVNEIGVQTASNEGEPIVGLPSLNVIKRVVCPESFVCPVPSDFIIRVVGNNPNPSSFTGSAMGTTVSLKPGSYEVKDVIPDSPHGLIALDPVLSVG